MVSLILSSCPPSSNGSNGPCWYIREGTFNVTAPFNYCFYWSICVTLPPVLLLDFGRPLRGHHSLSPTENHHHCYGFLCSSFSNSVNIEDETPLWNDWREPSTEKYFHCWRLHWFDLLVPINIDAEPVFWLVLLVLYIKLAANHSRGITVYFLCYNFIYWSL